jgi:hypothetical protein
LVAEPAICAPPIGPVTITSDDPRYEDLVSIRRNNLRFEARPETFRVVGSTEQVVQVMNEAVQAGKRVAVRSGGHCYENFVGDPSPGVVIDMQEMKAIYFDPQRNAFAIEPGALLAEVFTTLYLGWGVTIPGGECGTVAAGGHIQGGGYGPLSRLLGSIVDYLYAVEIVVVDRSGSARAVVATREPSDPNRDLWWAHTGGGGGNFGVVTRYWLRTPGVESTDPTRLLPKPPATILGNAVIWSWQGLERDSFRRLLQNHGEWFEQNSAPDSPYASLWSVFFLSRRNKEGDPGALFMVNRLDGTLPDAQQLLDDYVAAISEGVGVEPTVTPSLFTPYLDTALSSAQATAESGHFKGKSAYLRRRFTDTQIDTAYKHLTSTNHNNEIAMVWLLSYGGNVNAVAPSATAVAQRDSILKAIYLVNWTDPSIEAAQSNIGWLREFYKEMYAHTGGVPVPDEVSDGAYINYPDIDLADPQWNTSGVPWYTLYYKDNYPRLQQIKAKWDPNNVFHHALSIGAPD